MKMIDDKRTTMHLVDDHNTALPAVIVLDNCYTHDAQVVWDAITTLAEDNVRLIMTLYDRSCL